MSLDDQIKSLFDRLTAAWKTNDGATVAACFTEDGSLINPFGPRADGRRALAAMYTEYFTGGVLRGTSTTVELQTVRAVESNHAYADAEQTIRGADGQVVLMVHLSALLRREGDAWRFADCRPYAFVKA
jgi:uncharacterized protein (TIGR02246 family)